MIKKEIEVKVLENARLIGRIKKAAEIDDKVFFYESIHNNVKTWSLTYRQVLDVIKNRDVYVTTKSDNDSHGLFSIGKNQNFKYKNLLHTTAIALEEKIYELLKSCITDNCIIDPDFGPKKQPWSTQVPDIAKSDNHDLYPSGFMISPPIENPTVIYDGRSKTYPFQQEILDPKWSQLPPNGQGEDQNTSLDKMKNYYSKQRDEFTGYQCIEQFNNSENIAPFLNMSLNNIGDPFQNGYFTMNAKQAERGVLDFFASIWHAQWPSLPIPEKSKSVTYKEHKESTEYINYKESYWGYVLTMGSTEGNLYAVLSARDYLSGFSLLVDSTTEEEALCMPHLEEDEGNEYTPVAFYSEAAHYSLAKAVHAMQIKTFSQVASEMQHKGEKGWDCPLEGDWPGSVPVDDYGMVVINDLLILVEFFAKKGYPPFICFNYGTTFKGAYDEIPTACDKLKGIFKTYGLDERDVKYHDFDGVEHTDRRRGYWIHVDGALGASLMPFVEMGVEHGGIDKKNQGPMFDFRINEVMSLVTSGHKWPSSSTPTGVYMTKNKYLITPVATPDYLGSADTTFAGSRSGLSSLILWNLIAKQGVQGMVQKATRTMALCETTENKFKQLQSKLGKFDIWLQRAPNGGTSFIFRKPIDEIMFKYSLPIEVETIQKAGKNIKRTYVHLFIFWDRTEEIITNLISELDSTNKFDPYSEIITPINKSDTLNTRKQPRTLLRRSKYKGFR